MKTCFHGQINCRQNAENKLKFVPLFGAASQVGVPTMERIRPFAMCYILLCDYTIEILRIICGNQVAEILGFPRQNIIIKTLFPVDVIDTFLNLF